MTQKPWYSKGLRFTCSQCGNCCHNHGDHTRVYLARKDVAAIAEHLGLTPAAFLERHCTSEDGWTLLRSDADACRFLDGEGRCTIYPVRPKQCATWPFWEENLERARWEEAARTCCPGMGTGELHPASEVERIARETEAWYAED